MNMAHKLANIKDIIEIVYISAKEANEFLLPKHYSGRKPQISIAFGLKSDNKLQAVCTFGKPASNSLCEGICGKEFSKDVYELNRLCRLDEWSEPLSSFVSACLRYLSIRNWIIVSYSDTGMNHFGYIYQACNFLYTGCTKERTDKYTEGNKHSRHYSNTEQAGLRKVRSAKHRYLFLASRTKSIKKLWLKNLRYPTLPYPKGKSERYTLGDFQKPIIVSTT